VVPPEERFPASRSTSAASGCFVEVAHESLRATSIPSGARRRGADGREPGCLLISPGGFAASVASSAGNESASRYQLLVPEAPRKRSSACLLPHGTSRLQGRCSGGSFPKTSAQRPGRVSLREIDRKHVVRREAEERSVEVERRGVGTCGRRAGGSRREDEDVLVGTAGAGHGEVADRRKIDLP